MENVKVYLAGPLFTDAERQYNLYLKEKLEKYNEIKFPIYNLDVFLPQELDIDFSSETWQKDTFASNVKHIDESDIIIAVLDGPICDDGTSWEVGYAWAKGKKIFGLRTDFRTVGPEGIVNLMLGCSVDIFENIEYLIQNIVVIK